MSRGAAKTEVMATQSPQPQKIRPSWCAPKSAEPGRPGRGLERERGVGEQGEEAEVVEQRGEPEGEQRGVPQRPERGRQRHPGRRRWASCPAARRWPAGRSAISTAVPKNGPRQLMLPSAPPSSGPMAMPRPSAASYRMIARSAPPLAAPTMVASAVEMNSALPETPAGPEADDLVHRAAGPGQRREDDDQRQADEQRGLGAEPAGDEAGEEHRQPGDEQVAGEQQLGLGRRGPELGADRRQDRVDQPDPHERDDARERHGPDRLRLAQDAGGRFRAPRRRVGGHSTRPRSTASVAALVRLAADYV